LARDRESDAREAAATGITTEAATHNRLLREDAMINEVLAKVPQSPKLCPRCGTTRIVLDSFDPDPVIASAQREVYARLEAAPCRYCEVFDRQGLLDGRSPAEIEYELLRSRLSRKQRLMVEMALPAGERAELEQERAQRSAEFDQAIAERQAGVLPPGVPPLSPPIRLPCRFLTGTEIWDRMVLEFFERGVRCFRRDNPAAMLSFLPWNAVTGINVEAADAVLQRATVPRIAAGGIFALGFKKTFERSYVVVRHAGPDNIFEVDGKSQIEVRAILAPAVHWLATYGATVRAAAGR
jgi:hypothetical protein